MKADILNKHFFINFNHTSTVLDADTKLVDSFASLDQFSFPEEFLCSVDKVQIKISSLNPNKSMPFIKLPLQTKDPALFDQECGALDMLISTKATSRLLQSVRRLLQLSQRVLPTYFNKSSTGKCHFDWKFARIACGHP